MMFLSEKLAHYYPENFMGANPETYEGIEWKGPAPLPSPESIEQLPWPVDVLNLSPLEPWRFWAMLRLTGHEQDVLDYVAALNDPDDPSYDPAAWAIASAIVDHSLEYRRDHWLVDSLRQLVKMTETDLDALWDAGHNL